MHVYTRAHVEWRRRRQYGVSTAPRRRAVENRLATEAAAAAAAVLIPPVARVKTTACTVARTARACVGRWRRRPWRRLPLFPPCHTVEYPLLR